MNHRALTLIELLIAIGLLSVLTASVTGLMHGSAQLQEGFDRLDVTTRSLEQAMEQLSQDAEQAQGLFGIPFVGDTQSLQLARVDASRAPEDATGRDWFKVVYRLEPSGTGLALVRETFTFRTPDATAPSESRVLLQGLQEARFEFGWRNATTHEIVWRAPWPELEGHPVPQLIRFAGALTIPQGQQPLSIERVVRNPTGVLLTEESS